MSLTAADVAGMRSTLDASLPDSCAIVRDTLASDGAGGQVATPVTVATIACRIGPVTAIARDLEAITSGEVQARGSWVVTMPAGTDVTERDRITSAGVTYEIVAVPAPRSWEIGRRVLCRVVR